MVEIKTFEERKEELIKKGLEHGFITFEELAESLKGLEALVEKAGGKVVKKLFVLAEGDAKDRKDVEYLATIPLM